MTLYDFMKDKKEAIMSIDAKYGMKINVAEISEPLSKDPWDEFLIHVYKEVPVKEEHLADGAIIVDWSGYINRNLEKFKKLSEKMAGAPKQLSYQIQYASLKTMKKAKTVTVGARSTSAVLKKLKNKKKLYVRIRSWKKVNGKKIYSDWSKVMRA